MTDKFTIIIDSTCNVNGCKDCPLREVERGHGYTLQVCSHPKAPKEGYESVIELKHMNGSPPDWCPLREGSYQIVLNRPNDMGA